MTTQRDDKVSALGAILRLLEAVMNLLRNSLLMRKTGDRRRTELTEIFAFLCGFPAEFITRSSASRVRAPTLRTRCLILLKASSMGFISGE
jgi:hypothetical protein